jgi:hypothetical protein
VTDAGRRRPGHAGPRGALAAGSARHRHGGRERPTRDGGVRAPTRAGHAPRRVEAAPQTTFLDLSRRGRDVDLTGTASVPRKVGQRLREDGQAFRAAARQAQNLREVGLRGIPSLLSERQLRDRILDGLRRRVRVRLLLAQEPVDVLGAANVARSTSARPIRLALSQSMGTKRGKGERSFVLETRKQAIGFYRDLVQNLRPWRAAPPKLPDEPEDTPEAATP